MKNTAALLSIAGFAIFTTLSITGMLHHEPWLDEAHHWLLARDSSSLLNLAHNARYDGHPLLWDFILFAVSSLSKNPLAMQLTHLLISFVATLLFLRYSPFPAAQKILIIFSYYFFFEYTLISRNYALGWLLMVVLAILFVKEKKRYPAIIAILVLLSNTHFFFLLCTIPFFILVFSEMVKMKKTTRFILTYTLIYLVGAAIALWQIIPPRDSLLLSQYNNEPFFSGARFDRFFYFFLKGIFPLPDFSGEHAWNTNYFVDHSVMLARFLTLVVLALPFFCFHKKSSFFIYYFSLFAIAAAIYCSPLENGARYSGFAWMVLIICIWLDKNSTEYSSVHRYRFVAGKILLWCILLLQVFSGEYLFYKDFNLPFSEGKNVAVFLKGKNDSAEKIIVMPFYAGPPVAAYCSQKMFYLESDRYGTFCNWNTVPLWNCSDIEAKINSALSNSHEKNTALVLAYPRAKMDSLKNYFDAALPAAGYTIQDTASFDNGIVLSENYFVWRLGRIK